MRRRSSRRDARGPALLALALWLTHASASADPRFAFHAEGAAAGAIGDRSDQFGWGGSGLLAAELRLHPKLGVELPVGFLSLSSAARQDPAYRPTAAGSAVFVVPGIRLRPFAGADRSGWLWLAGGVGIADTSGVVAPALSLRVGADAHLGAVAVGPFVGLLQLVNVHGGVRPDDARVAMLGVHGEFQRRPPPPPVVPIGDRDHDGVRDDVDRCPDEPEDRDGFQDSDGCLDPDNDGDGVPDERDRCPDEPETVNGYEDADGCPDRAPSKEIMIEDHLELEQRVHFAVYRATVSPSDAEVIAGVAQLINDHPEYVRVRIAGHADESGNDRFNARLSERRAQAVWAELIHRGVSAQRLEVVAFGMSQPLRRERSAEAQRDNRRVEFEVVRRRFAPALSPEEEARTP